MQAQANGHTNDANLTFTKAEREFYTAFVKILDHLQKRAIKAERDAASLRKELEYYREKIEFDSIMAMDATPARAEDKPA